MVTKDIFDHKFIENVINASEDTIFVFNPQTGKAIIWNNAFRDMSGYSDEEIKESKAPDSYYDEEDLKKAEIASREILKSGKATLKMGFITKDGHKIPYEYSGTKLQSPEGNILIVSIGRNISEKIEAERKLKQSEQKYRSLTDGLSQTGIGIDIIDSNYNVVYQNQYLVDLFGDVEKRKCFECFLKREIPCEDCPTMKAIQNKKMEKTIVTAPNNRTYEIISAPLINHSGKIEQAAEVIIDITDRIESEGKLKESEEKFRSITEQSLMGISVIQNGVFKYLNDRVVEINGYSEEEINSWAPNEFAKMIHPDDREFVMEQARKKQIGDPDVLHQYKFRIVRNDGKIRWLEIFSKTITYDGSPADLIMTSDITDKIKAEEKLKQSEERYRLISEASKTVVWTTDMNLNLTYVSSNSPEILGYTAEESKTLPFSARITPESLNIMAKIFKDELKIERKKNKDLHRSRVFESYQIHKNGSIIPVEITFTFLHDEKGNAIGLLGISRDISERKKAEQLLKDSELKFKDLYEEAPNAYFSISPDKGIIRCNKAAERLLGYTKEELLDMKVYDLYADSGYGLVKAKEVFNQFLEGNTIHDIELQMKTKKGEIRWISLSVKPIMDEKGDVIESRSMILDINQRKIAQEELKKSYDKLKELDNIINNSPSIVFLWKNAEGWPVEFVSENIRQFGYSPEEFYSGNVIYSEIIHPSDLERVNNEVKQFGDKGVNEFQQEYRILTKSGEIRWIDDRTWIRRDLEGTITHYQGIVIDITDRKKTEQALRLSEQNYKEAYNMANFYKDLFTHDMNNILQIISSSAEIISFQLGDSEKSIFIENMTKMIKNQVERGSKLISDVRTLTSLDKKEISLSRINISKFLRSSIDFVKKAYNDRNIEISAKNVNEKLYIKGNELIQDVFDNILINGIKYNENSVIEISIEKSKQIVNGKNYIQIEFIDNGIGINDDRKKVIFQSGNRELKGTKGMGIGLSLVNKILTIFKGKIWVEDKVKGDYTKGSNFIVLLPEANST